MKQKTKRVLGEWIPIKKKPKEGGLYLVCAPTADPKMPLRHIAVYFPKEKEFCGLIPFWTKRLTHYMPFPKTPHDR